MDKKRKAPVIISVICIISLIIGLTIAALALASKNFDFKEVDFMDNYITKTYECEADNLHDIYIKLSFSKASIELSPDDKIHVIYNENSKAKYEINKTDSILKIEEKTRFFFWFNIDFQSSNFVIKIPQNYTQNLKMNNSASSINMTNVPKLNDVELDSSAGKIYIANTAVNSLTLHSSAGRVEAINIDIATKANINSSAGITAASNIRCKDICIKSSAGYVGLSNAVCSGSIEMESSAGSVEVDHIYAKSINLSSSAGSVKGTISGTEEDYAIDASSSAGNCNLNNKTNGVNKLRVRASAGSIKLEFDKIPIKSGAVTNESTAETQSF